jgi:hypothetical protein
VQNLALAVAMDKKPEVGGLGGLDSALQEQERIITMSYALASEASLKSKQVTGTSARLFNHLLQLTSQRLLVFSEVSSS